MRRVGWWRRVKMWGMYLWDREERFTVQDRVIHFWMTLQRIYPNSFSEKSVLANSSSMAINFLCPCLASKCPSNIYTSYSTEAKSKAANNSPSAKSSSSKIQLERNTRLHLSRALPFPITASPCSATFSNDRLHERPLSGAHLSHHTPEYRRQVATCQFN